MPVQPSKSVVSDTIGKETIVINIYSGAYYALTEAGSSIWAAVAKGDLVSVNQDALVTLISEGLLDADETPEVSPMDSNLLFTKYTDMESLLIGDPIHEVDEQGWPKFR
jgi:hypothetical protein